MYSAETFQNQYLPDGASEVNAVITVTSDGDGAAATATGPASEIVIVDCSGSMGTDKMRSARSATKAAIDAIRDGVNFAVIAGSGGALQVYPSRGLSVSSAKTRDEAKRQADRLDAGGGTAIGSWLRMATDIFRSGPGGINHAILLTDGKNEGESAWDLQSAIEAATGVFECDARGVGTDWKVEELRKIADALLGTVDIVANPRDLAADFTQMIEKAMGKVSADVKLRVWAPQGAVVRSIKQVAPQVEDLSGRRTEVSALVSEYKLGAWGAESRDYHIIIDVKPGGVGAEMLGARVMVVNGDQVEATTLVKAVWTDDTALSTRMNKEVAHYTGQTELARVIQEGLEARKSGDEETATMKFGRAAKLADESGNKATTELLEKVVDIEDAKTGTVRLKRRVEAADEMALDTRSTKTIRVGRQ